MVSHETVRQWCETFGPDYVRQVRRRRPQPGDKWHLDEMVIRMNGVQHYVWRAVDQRGTCLGVLVTRRRDTDTAHTFLRRLLKSQGYTPRVLSTDKLRSYGGAKREVMASVCHRHSKYLNNRAENSHQRTRHREYAMRRFALPGHASRLRAVHDPVYQHFRAPQHQMDAATHRAALTDGHTTWNEITADLLTQAGVAAAA